MQWFYLDANQQQVPADESELSGLVQNGTVTGETLLWNETMSDWQSAASLFPSWFAPAPAPGGGAPAMRKRTGPKLAGVRPGPKVGMIKREIHTAHELEHSGHSHAAGEAHLVGEEREVIKDLASFIGVNAGWMKFLGVMNIVIGVSNCLTVVGALVGWLPIWLGILMFKSANAAILAQIGGEQEDLEESLDRLSFFFKLQGIFLLVWTILAAVIVVLFFVMGVGAMFSIQQMGQELQIE